MLLSTQSKTKTGLLSLGVLVIMGAIVYKWIEQKPFVQATSQDSEIFADINTKFDEAYDDIRASLDQAGTELDNFKDEYAKETKRQQIIDEAKEYIDKLPTSTEEGLSN